MVFPLIQSSGGQTLGAAEASSARARPRCLIKVDTPSDCMTIARIAAPIEQPFQEHQTKVGVVDKNQ
jgi:hypothetical protein